MKTTEILPDKIEDSECLGRAVTSSKVQKKVVKAVEAEAKSVDEKRQEQKKKALRPEFWFRNIKKPMLEVSVDRLVDGAESELTKVQDSIATNNPHPGGTKRTFYGWVVLKASAARRMERKVKADPVAADPPAPANPYHANIHIPPHSNQDKVSLKDYLVKHASDLAAHCDGQPRYEN